MPIYHHHIHTYMYVYTNLPCHLPLPPLGFCPGNGPAYLGPGLVSSATWPSMSKKHYNGLIYQSIIYRPR